MWKKDSSWDFGVERGVGGSNAGFRVVWFDLLACLWLFSPVLQESALLKDSGQRI
jgi:hypothetical protein